MFANCFLSDFYFAENVNFPVPSQQIFAQISPILVNIDFLTLLWMNTLAFSLWREKLIADEKDKSEKKHTNRFAKNYLHCDTYLEVILPKVNLTIYPTKLDSNVNFRDQNFTNRPNGIEIGMAKLVLTNRTLSKSNNNYDEFSATCQKAYKFSSNLIEKNINFKNKVIKNYFEDNDIRINSLAPCFNEILQNDNLSLIRDSLGIHSDQLVNAKEGLFLKNLNRNALNKDAAKDIWIMDIESLWVDMIDIDCIPFVQNASFKIFAVNIWEFLSKSSILMEQTDQEDTCNKSSSKEYMRAFNRLDKIIKIEKKTEFDAKVQQTTEDQESQENLFESCSNPGEKKSIEKLNSTIDDYNVVTMQAEKDLIFNYIKYVYGLSTDMPNSSFNFNFVPSFKDLQKEQDSGYATEKSSLASNLSNKALSGLTKLTNKLSESGEDLLADDNDNISMILNLAQEDNVSVVSENMLDTTKYSPSRSISSASETSSFTASIGQMNKLDQLKSNSTSSNISKFTSNNNQIIQTDSAKTKVGIKLKNLGVYVQTQGENLMSLISLDQIKIRDKISQNFDENKLRDILIRFKKSSNDPESSNGLAELYVENFKIELDIPTLTALVDLVDDTDDFKTEITDTIAIKAYIYSCGVKLNDDPFKKYVNNPKALDLFVESLLFKKSSDNKLIINETKTRKNDEFDSASLRLQLNKNVFCESKFVQESKSDFSCYEFRSRQNLKIDSDKFASMVVMLRKEKETYHLLQTKMEKQKSEFNAKEKEMSSKLELVETENQILKKEIESLKMNRSMINNCEDDRIKGLNETLEIERKQFESLLLGSQEENELLKSKLKKTEDYVALLNIERECLMKKINQSKF
ncbi:UHRF1-binding 1 isoform X1 [Brachionus plicatilis]|uniref:UHRF1-binding 1 isoform X1 n=1 Tax=Brachionus plicatilis TaxID=10195 RepID=A0A3M7R1G6_BRAPC|nr:UHRF1-binding 1 isoform X1 [Brachionus plicatilis]